MTQICRAFTDGQLAAIVAKRNGGAEIKAIVKFLKKQYGLETTEATVSSAFHRYKHLFEVGAVVGDIKVLKDVARTKKANSQTAKENRTILNALIDNDDLLDQLKEMVKKIAKAKPAKAPKVDPTKRDMTVELLVSDVHVGKKTKTFNLAECRLRLRKLTSSLMQEIDRKSAHYNVERVIVALLGDLIENSLMHGKESMAACEFENPQQVRYAIELLYSEVIVPLAATGRTMDVVCIGGNHDRQDEIPTFNNPGMNSLSWIIYQVLKTMAERAGYKNIKWHIPDGVFITLNVYGDEILYEHGDRIKGDNSRKSMLAHMANRSGQLGKVLRGMRCGHFHVFSLYENGSVVVNGSVPGQDSYAEVNGFNSIPCQVVTFYVRTKNRDNSYYFSWPIQLGSAS